MKIPRVGLDVKELFQRMRLIPYWDVDRCASLNLVLVGLSGLGSVILQLLVLLGLGERGRTTLIDPDVIEPSNRSRIPYATPQDDGRPKVEVADRYVQAVRPGRLVRPLPLSLYAEEAQQAVAESDILIGAVDSELARVAMNQLAYAFCLPYLDGGAGFLVSRVDGTTLVHGGGQVRLVVPDRTPCLLCNLGVERETVDREVMSQVVREDQAEREVLERSGYIRGLEPSAAQPSVAHLNFLIAGALMTVLVEFLLKGLPEYQALHLDLEQMEWLKSTTSKRAHCAVCNPADLGSGRYFRVGDLAVPLTLLPEA